MAELRSIQTAAMDGDLGAVRLLLEKGTDVSATDGEGDTALHGAAIMGREEVVSFLLSSGADINRRGGDGRTALMYAAMCGGNEDVVRLLLRYLGGRGLDERDEDGCTALWLACWSRDANFGIVRVLLLAGADHTIPDNGGRTPHEIAQLEYHPQCTTAVIEWWKGELQRAYVLHKARTIHDDDATRQQALAAPVPAYLSPRLPRVEVRGKGGSGGSSTKGAAARGAEEEGGQETEEEDELCAMVGYVVKDLAAELYIELLAGFHQ